MSNSRFEIANIGTPTRSETGEADANGQLAAFRNEITREVEVEARSGRTDRFGAGFNVSLLTKDDMRMWKMIEDGTATRKAFERYEQSVKAARRPNITYEELGSRDVFRGFLADKMTPLLLQSGSARGARRGK